MSSGYGFIIRSDYEASQLKRQVVVQGRVKTMNESIYYIVDDLHKAITENKQISFSYMRWNFEKKMEPRKEKYGDFWGCTGYSKRGETYYAERQDK